MGDVDMCRCGHSKAHHQDSARIPSRSPCMPGLYVCNCYAFKVGSEPGDKFQNPED